MFGIAFAMAGQSASGGAQQGSFITSLLPLLVIFGIFYFLLIRPQQKQQKKVKEMLSSVRRGDKVITRGGIHGIVRGITENIIQVEIADNVKIKMNRDAIAFVQPSEEEAKDSGKVVEAKAEEKK